MHMPITCDLSCSPTVKAKLDLLKKQETFLIINNVENRI